MIALLVLCFAYAAAYSIQQLTNFLIPYTGNEELARRIASETADKAGYLEDPAACNIQAQLEALQLDYVMMRSLFDNVADLGLVELEFESFELQMSETVIALTELGTSWTNKFFLHALASTIRENFIRQACFYAFEIGDVVIPACYRAADEWALEYGLEKTADGN